VTAGVFRGTDVNGAGFQVCGFASPKGLLDLCQILEKAEIGKTGSSHLLRHTMATLMLEGGADIRFIQQMLGHASLSTTEMYTHVSIRMLKQVHSATHPAAHLERKKPVSENDAAARQELLAALDAEGEEENGK